MSYATIRDDFEAIIQTHGQQGTLTREEETTASMGDTTSRSQTGYTIQFILQSITKNDRQIHEMGLAVPGNMKAFFYQEYPDSITGNGTLEVKAGDMIEDQNGKWWRIEEIIGEREMQGEMIFKSAVLKKIDLDQ